MLQIWSGARPLWLWPALPPGMEELKQKGITEFIHIRSNVLETLESIPSINWVLKFNKNLTMKPDFKNIPIKNLQFSRRFHRQISLSTAEELAYSGADTGKACIYRGRPGEHGTSLLCSRITSISAGTLFYDVCDATLDNQAVCRFFHRRGVQCLLQAESGSRPKGTFGCL